MTATANPDKTPFYRPLLRRLRSNRRVRELMVTYGRFTRDGADQIAGHIAFASLFSMFPFLIVLVVLAGVIGQGGEVHALILTLLDYLPPDVAQALRGPIDTIIFGPKGGLLTFGILTALWSASNALESLRNALNRAFRVKMVRPLWKRRLQSLALVAGGALALPVALALLVFLPIAIGPAVDFFGLSDAWVWLVHTLRPPLVLAGTVTVVWGLLRLLPDALPPRRRVLLPPAAVIVLGWMALLIGFSVYLRQTGGMNAVYGSLGSMIATLLLLYLAAYVFLLGGYWAAVRSRIDRHRRRHAAARRLARRHMHRPGQR
ncbi:YihY/virulence factor BrkB family protein [Tistrella mobilis]|uniref:YihY/virulence factor BrkB family protein n=1 Tax=Tistrella mobilis TaxID=171437 RepID=UPI003558EDD0